VDPTYHQGEVEHRPDTAHDMSTILHDIREIHSTAASEPAQVLHASRHRRLAVRHHRGSRDHADECQDGLHLRYCLHNHHIQLRRGLLFATSGLAESD